MLGQPQEQMGGCSRTILSFAVLLSCVVTPLVAAGQNVAATNRAVPLILFDGVPLIDAIKNLARQINFNFIFDPRVPGSTIGPGRGLPVPVISARWENVAPQQALDALLKTNNLVMVTNPA